MPSTARYARSFTRRGDRTDAAPPVDAVGQLDRTYCRALSESHLSTLAHSRRCADLGTTPIVPTSRLCRPDDWIALPARDSPSACRHNPPWSSSGEIGRDCDRPTASRLSHCGSSVGLGTRMSTPIWHSCRWPHRARRSPPRRSVLLTCPAWASETRGLCRPRAPEALVPQGNPPPRRHKPEVGTIGVPVILIGHLP
jgi:hypothetical protein